MPNEDDISAGAVAGTGISQGLRHPLPRLAAASDPTKTSKIGMGRGSLHPHTAPGPPKDAQDKLSVSGRRLAVHSTGKPASGCRRAAFWEQPLCQHPMTQQEQTHHKDVMDGACSHVISLAPWWWEGTGKCRLHHEPEPAPNLHQRTHSNCDFPVPPVWDTSFDGNEFPVIWSFSCQLLPWTGAVCPAPGSALAKPMSTTHAWAPRRRELLSQWGCLCCRAGQGLSHPSIGVTVPHPSHEPVTSFFNLWSQESGFAGKFGKSK